jgi:hypothetical protein
LFSRETQPDSLVCLRVCSHDRAVVRHGPLACPTSTSRCAHESLWRDSAAFRANGARAVHFE